MNKIRLFAIIATCMALLFSSCEKKKENTETINHFENTISTDVYTPIVSMQLNGVERHWIIDSGANMSLIDETFYQDHKDDFLYLSSVDMTLNGVSGASDYTANTIFAELGYGNNKISHQFVTSNLVGVRKTIKQRIGIDVVGLIGADILSRYGYSIDFYNNAIYRHSTPIDSICGLN